MLFALMLLLLLFERPCPGGIFDKRELCRFTGVMKGSAPGIASSVRPVRAFGARARKDGVFGTVTPETNPERVEAGEEFTVHVQLGECVNVIVLAWRTVRTVWLGLFGLSV